jgi:GDP-4-dehydro-6-deoxy-D-mannose reductase
MKKVLITGVTSFVGFHLASHLLAKGGFQIAGTYRNEALLSTLEAIKDHIQLEKVDMMDGDLVDKTVAALRPDFIYHLAADSQSAQSFDSPARPIISNITLELHLLEALRKNNLQNTRVLVTSSAQVYGLVDANDLPVDEKAPLRPNSPYAVSKIAQDYLALQYFISYKLPIVRVRPFNHIGPGQRDAFALPSFARQIAQIEQGGEAVLKVGNLGAKRDFTDVRDVVRAYTLLMEKGIAGDVYNIGSGKSRRMKELLDIMLSFSSKKIEVVTDPEKLRPAEVEDFYCDYTKAHKLTGWTPSIPLEKTLQDILDYWRGIV